MADRVELTAVDAVELDRAQGAVSAAQRSLQSAQSQAMSTLMAILSENGVDEDEAQSNWKVETDGKKAFLVKVPDVVADNEPG